MGFFLLPQNIKMRWWKRIQTNIHRPKNDQEVKKFFFQAVNMKRDTKAKFFSEREKKNKRHLKTDFEGISVLFTWTNIFPLLPLMCSFPSWLKIPGNRVSLSLSLSFSLMRTSSLSVFFASHFFSLCPFLCWSVLSRKMENKHQTTGKKRKRNQTRHSLF